MNYATHVSRKITPQTQVIPGREAVMVQNSADGVSFSLDCWTRLERFLILGSEKGSYYATEQKLTRENAAVVEECIKLDPIRTIATIASISESGRAPKNTPAIFALVLATIGHTQEIMKQGALNRTCRTATHLFQFLEMAKEIRGHGSGFNGLVRYWYESKGSHQLALQVTKYRERNGYSHKYVIRGVRPEGHDPVHGAIYRWIRRGMDGFGPRIIDRSRPGRKGAKDYPAADPSFLPDLINTYEEVKRTTDRATLVRLIREKAVPREFLEGSHSDALTDPAIWDALLERMPLIAMIRSLVRMSNTGLIKPLSSASKLIVSRLTNPEYVQASKIHPVSLLMASSVYGGGLCPKVSSYEKTKMKSLPDAQIIAALDEAFYHAFGAVIPARNNHLIAIDVSGSMTWSYLAGTNLDPREGAAALATVLVRTEPWTHVMVFSTKPHEFQMTRTMTAREAVFKMDLIPAGGTDCAIPMLYALENKLDVDTFIVLTDSETWYGSIHPCQALVKYRHEMRRPNAKLIVVGMVSNGFTIADPRDPFMLDVIGFDANAPSVMADFARGKPTKGELAGIIQSEEL